MSAHNFPVVDADGKATGNARLVGVRTYVIKSYVEEIQRRRPVYTSATKSKASQPYDNRYGRPPEVHDLLSKIITEVNHNGQSPKSSDPNTGTYNQGRPHYGYDDTPNGQGGYGPPNHHHLGDYDVTLMSSSPIYDQRANKFPETSSNGKPGSQIPNGYEIPDSRWGNPEARDKRVPSNKWDKLSSPAYDHPQENPEKRWDGSARKTKTPEEYEVPSNQWERSMTPESPREYGVMSNPGNQWGSPPVKPQGPGDYGVPSSPKFQRGSPPSDYGPLGDTSSSPKNQWASPSVKPQSPREYRVASDPRNQWGSSPAKPERHGDYVVHPSSPKYQSPGDYGSPSNQHGRPSSPKYQRGSPPGDYGLLDDRSLSPKNQWAGPPVKPQSPREYEVASDPRNKWGSSPVKPESHMDYVVHPSSPYGSLSNQRGRPSSPVYDNPQKSSSKNQLRSSPLKPDESEEGLKSSNLYIPGHQQLEKNTNQKLSSGSYNDMGQAFDQLSLDSTRGTVGPRQEDVARRYGSRKYESGEDRKRSLTSKEAIDKYNGSFVPK